MRRDDAVMKLMPDLILMGLFTSIIIFASSRDAENQRWHEARRGVRLADRVRHTGSEANSPA